LTTPLSDSHLYQAAVICYHERKPFLENDPAMKRLPVIPHLPVEEVKDRYRRCPDPKEKTRWHLLWLLSQPGRPLSCEQAAPLVGLSDVYARAVLKRWNAYGPAGLADRRKANKSPGKLTAAQQAELFDALQQEPPDGGLWSGPKVVAFVRDRWGVVADPTTGWRWLKKLGFRLVVPRPRHPQTASAEQQRRWL
jgi:transposase